MDNINNFSNSNSPNITNNILALSGASAAQAGIARRSGVSNRLSVLNRRSVMADTEHFDLEGQPIEKIPHHRLASIDEFDALYDTKSLLGKYGFTCRCFTVLIFHY